MSDMRRRFVFGLFVLITLILLGSLIILFEGSPKFMTPYNHYTILFSNATGVAAGTPVRKSGVRIGEVESLALDNDSGKVQVGVKVEKPFIVRHNDQAMINSGLLAGDTTIDLVPRPATDEEDKLPLAGGAIIVGEPNVEIRSLLTRTSELLPETQQVLIDIRNSLKRFDQLNPQMEATMKEIRDLAEDTRKTIPELRRTNDEVLIASRNWGRLGERLDVMVQTDEPKVVKFIENANDAVVRLNNTLSDENQRNVSSTLKNLRAGTENLDSISKNSEEFLKESRQSLKRLNDSLIKADDLLTNLQKTTKPFADRSEIITRNVDESTARLNRVLADIQDLLRCVAQKDGTVQRLLADPSLFNNVNEATFAILKIMPRLDRILHDVEVFADKIARHPESLGLGGVVTPSAGLKEAPTNSNGHFIRPQR